MKIKLKILVILLFLLNLTPYINCQNIKYSPITQDEYLKYFPSGINGSFVYNTNEIVTILPTNEQDTILQNQNNKILRTHFNNYFNKYDYYTKTRVITDIEALNEDLSKSNIVTIGTINGNLYTKYFLETVIDFPIKIYNDSIVSDSAYHIDNYVLMATWVNPDNKTLPIQLLIPKNYSLIKEVTYGAINGLGHCSFSIWDEKNEMDCKGYQMNNGKWSITGPNDMRLVERDNSMGFKMFKLTPEIKAS
jgi:hypothetical protein